MRPVSQQGPKVLAVFMTLAAGWLAPAEAAKSGAKSGAAAQGGALHDEPPLAPPSGEPPAASHSHCEEGFSNVYPCQNVDLLAFLPRSAIGAGGTANLNDVWGWTDTASGREYALVGTSNGTSFVDLSDPEHPVYLGQLPTRTKSSVWRSIKVYRDHAYIVADRADMHGMQVFDLTELRAVAAPPITFGAVSEYFGPGLGLNSGTLLGSAHNVAIDEESGFAFIVGSNTCAAGLHIADIREPARPVFAGCFALDGYTHDTQCVVYHGPDLQHAGRQICFNSNEDTLTIVDVSSKSHPRMLARSPFSGSAYVHQGWLTEDHRYFLMDDELDEIQFGHGSRTYIWDVRNLDAPTVIGRYTSTSRATDHNLYIRGDRVYQANYRSGLRILDLAQVADGKLSEIAYFDIVPESDAAGFSGAWNVYPFFPSGVVVVSGIEQGLYVLRPFPAGDFGGAGEVK